jgi:hypothetical protein
MFMPEPHKMTDEQKAMYTGVAMSRNNEVTLRWSRSTILTLINGAGLSLLGTQLSNPIPILYLILGIFGMSLCSFWWFLNRKTQLWIDYWHSCLAKMEPPHTTLFVFRVFTGTAWERVNKWPTFQWLLNLLPYTFFVVWLIIMAMFLFVEKKEPANNPTIILFQFNTPRGGAP